MDDGSTRQVSLPVEIWYGGDRYGLLVPEGKKVVKATIDPRSIYPDVRRENNAWSAPPTAATAPQSSP
jgi:hypothetical protein